MVPTILIALVACGRVEETRISADSIASANEVAPNILLIVADDLGYSDLGAYGGEIDTPVLDALAAAGTRYTRFYVAPTCSPTRAMLMTGADHHRVGLGNMAVWLAPNQRGKPGYEGYLSDAVPTLPEVLASSGYRTYMAGKWHLGQQPGQWPSQRGFQHDFSLIGGAGSHFSDMGNLLPQRPKITLTHDGHSVDELPPDYFSTKNFTDFIIGNLRADRQDERPFFAYLALQTPHVPLQIPDSWRQKYRGQYDDGYEALRSRRLARQQQLGLLSPDAGDLPWQAEVSGWSDLSERERRVASWTMEVYAAIVANMDHHVGRLLDYLREAGLYDNTIIIFMSDNGAAAGSTREFVSSALGAEAGEWFDRQYPVDEAIHGRSGSWIDYGPAWAQVSSAPFRWFKATVFEGGIRVPLIISGPGLRYGDTDPAAVHVTDLANSLISVARTGRFERPRRAADQPIGMELFGQRAVIRGIWKAVRSPGEDSFWQLYDLEQDPGESRDLAELYPDRVAELAEVWQQYARDNGVVLPEGKVQPAMEPMCGGRSIGSLPGCGLAH